MSYLFEMHYHTPNTSYCGSIGPKDAIPKYVEAGYSGVVITDHYYKEWFEDRGEISWNEKIDRWLDGYHAALEAAEGYDFRVILGVELRFPGGFNDYLVYGIDEQFLKDNIELYLMTPAEFRAFADKNGLFFSQAHPFRVMCSPQDATLLHGVEVFNGNLRHNSHNDITLKFAEDNNLIKISGSDFHEWEDLCRGGCYLKERPADSKELSKLLFSGGVEKLVTAE